MSDDLARRQANVAKLRTLLDEMSANSAKAEAARSGRAAPQKAETPEAALVRLRAEASQPIAPLSPSARRTIPELNRDQQEAVA